MPSPATSRTAEPQIEAHIAAQRAAIAELERALWAGGLNEALLEPYQAAFRELERLIAEDAGWARRSVPINDSSDGHGLSAFAHPTNPEASAGQGVPSVEPPPMPRPLTPGPSPEGRGEVFPSPSGARGEFGKHCFPPSQPAGDATPAVGRGARARDEGETCPISNAAEEFSRHAFVIVIPVADSPRHLKNCLASLLELCRTYGYGGLCDGRWRKVAVLLADDSSDPENIERNRAIAREFDQAGLTTHYFGLSEQLALTDRLAGLDLAAIVGRHEREAFGHKGQAMTRNLAWLKCAEMAAALPHERLLFYTVDADQAFRVKVATPEGGREVCAVNFLYRLDEIFTRTDALALTGKVVGDPPVSPAVMAGNFLDDVIAFLREMAAADPRRPYRQPGASTRGSGEAAYHDMAELFGFSQGGEAYRYRCPLPGEPDNAACFADFSRRLNRFFHGEHPTRVSWYRHAEALSSVQPARTVYTGNYAFRPEALGWFIPFAPLRLRMSGPTMGRMLKAELGGRFVSANLPLLHKRTLESTGQAEFRPGVLDRDRAIDLCGEFERQFHGDVMLFSMERLTALGYPGKPLPEAEVEAILAAMQTQMRERYRIRQQAILERLGHLNGLLDAPTHWWNRSSRHAEPLANFRAFAGNLKRNFGADSPCHARIDAPGLWEDWRGRQLAAIAGYHRDRQVWNRALALLAPSPVGREGNPTPASNDPSPAPLAASPPLPGAL